MNRPDATTADALSPQPRAEAEEPSRPPDQERLAPEPMDPQLTDIQPGGGVVIRLEQWWGRLRRRYLKTFRPGYVARMAELRRGGFNPCPHEVLDSRDLKFHRNQGGWHWNRQDDPFTWRERLPFARDGLAELLLIAGPALAGAALLLFLTTSLGWPGWARWCGWAGAVSSAVVGALVVWFFRDSARTIPQGTGLVVSPADGKVVSVREIEHDEFVGGPAVEIGIFLSIFNVHINRMPVAVRIIGLRYRPGKCLNALRAESARENEQLALRIEADQPPHRRMVVRQITGAIARRIVCGVKPGDELSAGQAFGMIKLGSRTELVLPREAGLVIEVSEGAKVRAGSSVLAVYRETDSEPAAARRERAGESPGAGS